ncbi:DUF4123 domain-containing protein [Halomonas sp. M4R1S46]|uniref:DUF4123 domain-containing protein n=1 Tax=Halomonas sp. M4R1S46 TaxID=2982692 RepID=UPI0021E445DD|nr:DUF4123 domain-containing protein [Halomonas sp. M4R1S46]UYG07655.1 DUF4123 domain-containing protein [Halomonas sp. M4R1S46]
MTVYHYLMIDGSLNPEALKALYAPEVALEVWPLLHATAYAALAASGPLLAVIAPDSHVDRQWQGQQPPYRYAWRWTSDLSPDEAMHHWQARLIMRAPFEREVWLRFADARVISRALQREAMPPGFWEHTVSAQLPGEGAFSPWERQRPDSPPFFLSERRLAALAAPSDTEEVA